MRDPTQLALVATRLDRHHRARRSRSPLARILDDDHVIASPRSPKPVKRNRRHLWDPESKIPIDPEPAAPPPDLCSVGRARSSPPPARLHRRGRGCPPSALVIAKRCSRPAGRDQSSAAAAARSSSAESAPSARRRQKPTRRPRCVYATPRCPLTEYASTPNQSRANTAPIGSSRATATRRSPRRASPRTRRGCSTRPSRRAPRGPSWRRRRRDLHGPRQTARRASSQARRSRSTR